MNHLELLRYRASCYLPCKTDPARGTWLLTRSLWRWLAWHTRTRT